MQFKGINSIKLLTLPLFVGLLIVSPFSANGYGQEISREKMKKEQLVLIINYPYQIWSNEPTKIHLTLFKPDFKPAVGAEVTVNDQLVGKADENGVCIFDYEPGTNEDHRLVATLEEEDKIYEAVKNFSSNSRTVSFRADRLYVYTDRGVYDPGQDILVRIIAWQLKGEYKPVPEAKIQLLFQNPAGKVFSGEYLETNEFGVAASKLSLPANMPEGDYQLVVLYQKARETASIRVKRFVPPVISIKHNLKRYFTDTQEELDTQVELTYFAGGEMRSSKLVFSVLSLDKEELFIKDSESEAPVYHISLSEEELDAIRGKLSLETTFKIKLAATDSYGQKSEIIWDLTYTARPYTAVLEMDKDAYPAGEKVQILTKVVDLDKQPAVKIPLILEVPELKIKKEVQTDARGVAVFEFTMAPQTVEAVLKSPIMKPVLAKRIIPYQSAKPMSSKVSEPPKGVGTKTTITVTFDPEYIPIEKIIHLDMTDISGALVVATTIPIYRKDNKYVARGQVTAPTWGTMLVNLYGCAILKKNVGKSLSPDSVGFITEGQHITFYPDKELEIVLENFKPSVSPGEKVEFKVNIKGGKGEKCLGVSIVDEAVISLLDPFMMSPISHFYGPQAKVISTGGAGVLTWPVVDRNWGSPWRDIAYTNWGWKAPGPFVSEMYREVPEEAGKLLDTDIDEAKAPMYKSEGMAGELGKVREQESKKPEAKIVIRTSFPETTLWEPLLITENGKAKLSVQMPDAITTQKLSILATDKEGFIGLLREDIKVVQPLFIRAALPATMVLGDNIKVAALVRNLTSNEITGTANLFSEDLKILSNKEIAVRIPKNEGAVVEWEISGKECGPSEFTVSVKTADFSDYEQKNIFVLPTGEPRVHLVRGSIEGEGAFYTKFSLDEKATYRVVNINVSLPSVFPAIQAWWAFDTRPWYSPWAVAATAIMNASMLEYTGRMGGDSQRIELLRQKLSKASIQLAAQQFPSGAWGWYFLADATASDALPIVGGENLYYTTYVLRALAEIRKANLLVEDRVMLNAMKYILGSRNSQGLWSSKGAYFWEVFNEATDNALSAEIFEVLMLTATVLPTAKEFEKDFTALNKKMINLLKSDPPEPMTVAAAVQGLSYYSEFKNDHSARELLQESIDYLITLKRRGYWEPHWYHAYGGMVELNARILGLLAEFDPQEYESYLREGMTWLLSTREAWGTWHNEIGTANAIRALLKTGAFAEDKESEITLIVNEEEVARLTVDPKDPYLSAAKLRYFEITPWAKDGDNTVEVQYNGNLTASVILEVKEWGIGPAEVEKLVKIERSAPTNAILGEPVRVKLTLSSQKILPILAIEENIPANSEVDILSLDQLKKAKKITNYRVAEGKVYLVLVEVEGEIILEYKLKAARTGIGLHAGTRVIDTTKGELLATTISAPFDVN